MPQMHTTRVTIATSTIFKVVAALLILWGLYLIADIILLLVASVLLAAALDPWVDGLHERHHIPRAASILGIYVIIFAVISVVLILIVPPVIEQIGAIAQNFPTFYENATRWYMSITPGETTAGGSIPNPVSLAAQSVFSAISGIFGGLVAFLTVLVMTFYLVVDEGAIKRTVAIAPKQYQTYLANLYERVQAQIGIWLRAQLQLMAIVGVLTFILLSVLPLFGFHMPYALVLALIAGLTEFIPYIGPIIGAIPAVFLAYSISPTLAIVVAAIYYGIQLLENNVLVPKIMERALGLSPIISIVVFLVGAKLAGITGAFLSIPIATAAAVVLKDLYTSRRDNGSSAAS